jgi:GNAT superfamily N-acetyltransferase
MTIARRNTGKTPTGPRFEFHPLTTDRWADFVRLFGQRGACGGCWCMWWRVHRAQFTKQKGAGNKRAMKGIVASGEVPGLLAMDNGEPVGWCCVGPREMFPVLARSRVLRPVDDQPVWSVVCFFVDRSRRGQGLSRALLRAAVTYAAEHGARIVEGYPVEPRTARLPDAFAWTGLAAAFHRVGFKEVARRSPTRPIMRYKVRLARKGKANQGLNPA